MPHLCKRENVDFTVVNDITDHRTLASHRPDIQTAELHTTMWESMITGVDEVCRIDAVTDRMLTLLYTTGPCDDLDISTPVYFLTGAPVSST